LSSFVSFCLTDVMH